MDDARLTRIEAALARLESLAQQTRNAMPDLRIWLIVLACMNVCSDVEKIKKAVVPPPTQEAKR